VGGSGVSADLSMIPHPRPVEETSTTPGSAADGGASGDQPPVWPPLAPPVTTPASPSPASPEEPDEAPESDVNGAASADQTPAPGRGPDETVELPIYREVESVWFRTRRTPPAGSGPGTQAARYATEIGRASCRDIVETRW